MGRTPGVLNPLLFDSDEEFRSALKAQGEAQGWTPDPELMHSTEDEGETFIGKFLEHYGVKGMKWGVRKSDSGPAVATQKRPGGKVKTKGGEGQPAHPDAKKAAELVRTAKKSRTDALSNDELQAAIRRMQLEQQFSQLEKGRRNAGRKFISKLLGDVGAEQARSVASTQAAYQVDQQLSKHGKPIPAKSKYKFAQ